MTALPTAPKGARRRPLRLRWWSGRVSPRTTALVAVATVLLGVVAVGKMMLGDFPISPLEVITAVAGGGSDHEGFIVRSLRLPRVPVGAGAGVALAASGSIFQGLVRNPLVAPDIIGVMAGATVAAVTAIVVFQSATVVPVAAFLGAVIATFVVYGLTCKRASPGVRPRRSQPWAYRWRNTSAMVFTTSVRNTMEPAEATSIWKPGCRRLMKSKI